MSRAESRGPEISRAVVERPVPGLPRTVTPELRRPRRRLTGRNLIIAGTAVSIAAAGTGIALTIGNNTGQPQETPFAGIIEPSQSPIPTPVKPGESIDIPPQTAEPSEALPTPSTEPTPTPTQTAEVTPTPTPQETSNPIESVKVVGGYLRTSFFYNPPYHFLVIKGATIVAIEDVDPKTGDQWIAVSTVGKKIKQDNCHTVTSGGSADGKDHSFKGCDISGTTNWLKINTQTNVRDSNYTSVIGHGPAALDPLIQVGERLSEIDIFFGTNTPFTKQTSSDVKMNVASWNKLHNSIGKHFPRENKIFKFAVRDIAPDY